MSRFAAVPTKALDDPRVGQVHMRVLLAVASYADKDGYARVRLELLAERSRSSISRVSMSLTELVEFGWIRKHARDVNGRRIANAYLVVFDIDFDPSIFGENDPVQDDCDHDLERSSFLSGKGELSPPENFAFSTRELCFSRGRKPIKNTVSNTVSNTKSNVRSKAKTPETEPFLPDKSFETGQAIGEAETAETNSDDLSFETAWKLYTSCPMKATQVRKKARSAWKVAARKETPERIMDAIAHEVARRQAFEARRRAGTLARGAFLENLPQMHRWLEQERFSDVLDRMEAAPSADHDRDASRLALWRASEGKAWPKDWGEPPQEVRDYWQKARETA